VLSRTQYSAIGRWIGRLLLAVSLLAVVSAAINILAGGYSLEAGPFRLASHSFPRDLGVAIVSAVAAAIFLGREGIDALAARAIVALERRAILIAAAVSLTVFVVAMAAATRCACASDQYGYVSEADLLLAGTLHVPQPLASVLPWPIPEWTLSPLGYRPATYPGAIVPTYPPGLPLAMALAIRTTGIASAAFVVVPILSAVAVWCTFLLGRRLDSAIVGLFGALLLACSATFIFQMIQPMSDVPATAWWLVAAVLLFHRTRTSAFLSGLAVSAAVLTRPNLVPLFLAFVVFVGVTDRSLWLWFMAGALPGPLAVAWLQNRLYGSPLTSGYGALRDIYAVENAPANLKLFAAWFWESHGAFIFIALLSPLAWPGVRAAARETAGRTIVFALPFIALLFVAYVFYTPFDNWTYTRFLLPGVPFVLLLGVATSFVAGRRLGSPAAQVVVLLALTLVACSWLSFVADRRVLSTRRGESRYIVAGRDVASTAGPDVLVIAMQHSGSVRYYSGRTTIRYDWIDNHALDTVIAAIHAMNRGPLLVLEDWEEPRFRERFSGQKWGALDWPPRVEIQSQPRVRVYDPFDRARFLANERIQTREVRLPR
jgi:hypothetical protein